MARAFQLPASARWLLRDIDEGDARALLREGGDDGGADAAAAAGDEDGAAAQAGIDRERSPLRSRPCDGLEIGI